MFFNYFASVTFIFIQAVVELPGSDSAYIKEVIAYKLPTQ